MLTFFAMMFVGALGAAQAPAPPAQPAIAGTWTFDPYVSDHPQQIALALRVDTGEGRGGERGREGGARGTFGRGGNEPNEPGDSDDVRRSGEQRSRATAPAISDADRKLLTELTEAVRFPPLRLTITQTGTGVTVRPDRAESIDLRTDGKSEKRQLTSGTVDQTAAWDADQLKVAYTVGDVGTLSYTYAVAPTTGQLVVRVTFTRTSQPESPLEIKLVYDSATK
jgi:hypothetical protein